MAWTMKSESSERPRRTWLWVRLGLSLALTVGIGWWVFSQVRIDEVLETLKSAAWPWALLAWLFSAAVTLFKSLRFRALLPTATGGFTRLWGLQSLHMFLNALFPAGLSEFANAYLLRRGYGTPWSEGAVALIIGRILDVCLFAGVLLVLRMAAWPLLMGNPVLKGIVWLSTAGMGVALGVCGVLAFKREALIGWAHRVLQRDRDARLFLRVCARGIGAFALVQSDPVRYVRATVWSICLWAAMYGMFHSATRALAPGFQPEHTLFVYLLLWVVSVLPVRGVANLGTHEGGWVMGLLALGYAREEAIRLALGTHVVFFAIAASVGLIGLGLLGITSRIGRRLAIDAACGESHE